MTIAFSLAATVIAADIFLVVFVVPESLDSREGKPWRWSKAIPFRSVSLLWKSRLALGTGTHTTHLASDR